MTDHTPHDWLSPFLDGEMTADERAAAERRLQDDAGAQCEFEQFREIGNLLRALPRHEPPAGFSTVVLSRCERESLLGGEPFDARTVAASRANAGSRKTRSTAAIVASILATAAMLFLLVQVVSPPGAPSRDAAKRRESIANEKLVGTDAGKDRAVPAKASAQNFAERRSDSAATAPNPDAGANPAVAASTAAKSGPKDLSKSTGSAVTQSFANRNRTVRSGGQGQRAPGPLRLGGGGRGAFGATGGAARFEMGDREAGFRIGEVVPYLQVAGDRTAVIEVTVVDVNRAVGRLEVLLERKLVKPLTRKPRQQFLNKSELKSNLLSLKGAADDKQKSELIAVYVESTQAQLAEVMRELDRETQSLHVSLRPPVALGDVRLNADGNGWANLFRRDRRRSPQTLAEAAEFGRQAVTQSGKANEGSRAGVAAPGLTRRSAGVTKDEAGKRKTVRLSADKENSKKNIDDKKDVGNQRKSLSDQEANKKPADPAANSVAAAEAAARSFQLRLKLSDQHAARDERDRNGQKERFQSRTDPRRKPVRQAREPARSRGTAVSRPVQVIFVFRATTPREPVPAARP